MKAKLRPEEMGQLGDSCLSPGQKMMMAKTERATLEYRDDESPRRFFRAVADVTLF